MSVSNPASFYLEAQSQKVCAVCGEVSVFDAHHVVERQELRKLKLPEWDTRGALRLCTSDPRKMTIIGNQCHGGHTGGSRRVRLVELTDDNVSYAFEALGPYAYFYLLRRYTGHDDRVEDAYLKATAEEIEFP